MRDVLLVSLGGTTGLREADAELAASLERAGASVEVARGAARARVADDGGDRARVGALRAGGGARGRARAGGDLLELDGGAAGAAAGRDPLRRAAAGNRPGRHGLWQRPVERRRFREAALLVPWSEGGLAEAPSPHADAVVVPVPVEAERVSAAERDIAAITYGAHPEKKGLDRVLAAWAAARRDGEELVVAGLDGAAAFAAGRARAAAARRSRRALRGGAAARRVPRAAAPRAGVRDRAAARGPRDRAARGARRRLRARHDAVARPYAALPIARALDPRLVTDDLAAALRAALDEPAPGYAERAAEALRPYAHAEVDRVVADVLLPRLLDSGR